MMPMIVFVLDALSDINLDFASYKRPEQFNDYSSIHFNLQALLNFGGVQNGIHK